MPDQSPPRRRFRLLRWSLFGLALVGLGFLLNNRLPARPRCTIASATPVFIDSLSPEGRTVVTVPQIKGGGIGLPDFRGPLRVWDTHSGQLAGSYLELASIWTHVYSPRQRYVAAVEDSHGILLHLIDLGNQGQRIIPFKELGEPGEETELTFSPGESFVLFSNEKTSCLVNSATGEILKSFKASPLSFRAFTADESLFLYETDNGRGPWNDLHILNTRSCRVLHTLPQVTNVTLSPDGRTVAATMPAGWVFLDLATFKTRPFAADDSLPRRAMFSPDGQTLAIVFKNGKLEFWDVVEGKRRGHALQPVMRDVTCVFSPDSTYFCLALGVAAEEGVRDRLVMWEIPSATLLWTKEITSFLGFEKGVGFTADSRFFAHCDELVALHVMEARTGETLHVLPPDRFFDGPRVLRYLTVGTETLSQPNILQKLLGDWWPGKAPQLLERVQVFDVASGAELACMECDSPHQAICSEDGKTLVTLHNENSQHFVRIWDIPLRPPLRLVIGIPLGLGLLVLLFSSWRSRRRGRAAVATVGPVTIPEATGTVPIATGRHNICHELES